MLYLSFTILYMILGLHGRTPSFICKDECKYDCFRYIYVCYAADLASGGERLLNMLISVVIVALCLPWVIIYPIIGNFFVQDYPLNTVKGKICSLTINKLSDEDVLQSIKAKIILITFGEHFLH